MEYAFGIRGRMLGAVDGVVPGEVGAVVGGAVAATIVPSCRCITAAPNLALRRPAEP